MGNEKDNLLFDIRRSIRYHDRRIAHFEQMHQLSSILTVLLAGSILIQIAGAKYDSPWWLTFISILAAVLSSLDIVIGYSKCASHHHELKRKFCDLEGYIEEANTEVKLAKCKKMRVTIEQHEPPIYRALDLLCHNEQMAADGFQPDHKDYMKLHLLERLTANYIRWPNIGAAASQLFR